MTKKSRASKRERSSLLCVPQHGAQIRSVRISAFTIVICALLILCGFVGYFIPISRFAVDVVEQNQKKKSRHSE